MRSKGTEQEWCRSCIYKRIERRIDVRGKRDRAEIVYTKSEGVGQSCGCRQADGWMNMKRETQTQWKKDEERDDG